MRVVDTSAWIEGFIKGRCNPAIRRELPPRDRCVVPTIVQFELQKWAARNLDKEQAVAAITYTTRCIAVPLDAPLAIRAADLGHRYKLAMADAIVYATALESDTDLLTCDAHFRGLDKIIYMPKG